MNVCSLRTAFIVTDTLMLHGKIWVLYVLTLKIAACHISFAMLQETDSLVLCCCDCDDCWWVTAIATFSSSLIPQRCTRNLARYGAFAALQVYYLHCKIIKPTVASLCLSVCLHMRVSVCVCAKHNSTSKKHCTITKQSKYSYKAKVGRTTFMHLKSTKIHEQL